MDRDYEKAYKAVLKTAQQWIEDGCTDKERICLESVFPELRESEDERIRRALIDALKTSKTVGELKFVLPEPTREECIAYLEKQKEQSITANDLDEEIHRFFDDCIDVHEAKLYGSVSERVIPVDCYEITARHFAKWGEEQKEQKPAEWSEEDRLHYTNVLEALEYVKGCKSDYDKIEAVKSDIAWFKSLRPQPKQECDEEDEILRVRTINRLETLNFHGISGKEIRESIDWLKSLRNRPKPSDNWKPSEEQMRALNTLNCHGDLSYVGQQSELISLYNDLKKLM